jgi:hypothetical protein
MRFLALDAKAIPTMEALKRTPLAELTAMMQSARSFDR